MRFSIPIALAYWVLHFQNLLSSFIYISNCFPHPMGFCQSHLHLELFPSSRGMMSSGCAVFGSVLFASSHSPSHLLVTSSTSFELCCWSRGWGLPLWCLPVPLWTPPWGWTIYWIASLYHFCKLFKSTSLGCRWGKWHWSDSSWVMWLGLRGKVGDSRIVINPSAIINVFVLSVCAAISERVPFPPGVKAEAVWMGLFTWPLRYWNWRCGTGEHGGRCVCVWQQWL